MKKSHIAVLIIASVGLSIAALLFATESAFRNPHSEIAAAKPPAFTPDPALLANPFARPPDTSSEPWLEARSSDPNVPPGAQPATTFIVSRVEPVITQEGSDWKITFKTP